jgi:hypothetical protein
MDYVGRSPKIRNVTIFMVFVGAIHILCGYFIYQFISFPGSFHTIIGMLMMVFGFLTFCSSLTVWLQKSMATKVIAGVGVAICVPFIIFVLYFLVSISALLYATKLDYTRKSLMSKPTE